MHFPIPYLIVSSAILYGPIVEMMCVNQQLCITQKLIRNAGAWPHPRPPESSPTAWQDP